MKTYYESTFEHPEYEFDASIEVEISTPTRGNHSSQAETPEEYYGEEAELEGVGPVRVVHIFPLSEKSYIADREPTEIERSIITKHLESAEFTEWMQFQFEE